MLLIRKAFRRLHYPADIIAQCVRWYLAYSLSLRDIEEMMAERGVILMVRKMNHRFKNFLTMNSSVYNAVMMCHRERYSHKMLFSARF